MRKHPLRHRHHRAVLLAALAASIFATSARAQDSTAPADPASAPATPPAGTVASAPRGGAGPALTGPSLLGIVEWWGLGVGGRYMIPLGIPSLLTRTPFRDSWALEPGIDFIHRSDNYGVYNYNYNELTPTVGMMWIVWLRDDFAVYPKLEAGWSFGFSTSNSCVGCNTGGIYTEGAAGLLYRISGLTLRAEVGNYGAKGGLAWLF
jgi:hypothetical protein